MAPSLSNLGFGSCPALGNVCFGLVLHANPRISIKIPSIFIRFRLRRADFARLRALREGLLRPKTEDGQVVAQQREVGGAPHQEGGAHESYSTSGHDEIDHVDGLTWPKCS